MPVLTIVKGLAIGLALGAFSLFLYEWRYYHGLKFKAKPSDFDGPDRGRLLRRTLGAIILFVLSVVLFFARLPQPGESDSQVVMALFSSWLVVLGLALILGGIAIADTLCGIRKLSAAIASENGHELAELQEQIKRAQKG